VCRLKGSGRELSACRRFASQPIQIGLQLRNSLELHPQLPSVLHRNRLQPLDARGQILEALGFSN
jgi:hypothetical protein